MPPDDEAAYKQSPHTQSPGHAGVGDVQGTAYLEMIKTWDEQNRAERTAEAEAKASTALKDKTDAAADTRTGPVEAFFNELAAPEKGFLLKLDQSVELGVVNSRDYQRFREELYQAALPVTAQRFSFAYQWAAVENAVRTWAGPLSPSAGPQNNWTLGTTRRFHQALQHGGHADDVVRQQRRIQFHGPAWRQHQLGHQLQPGAAAAAGRRPGRYPGAADAGGTQSGLFHPGLRPLPRAIFRGRGHGQ